MGFEEILIAALVGTATDLEHSSARTRERELEDALFARLSERLSGRIVRQVQLQLRGWPGVGGGDIGVRDEETGSLALLELKWGAKKLYNCAWDAAKLAAALSEGAAARAYLVAGAPLAEWRSGERGAELFGRSDWSMAALLHSYAPEFAAWRREVKTRPAILPATFSTRDLGAVDLEIADARWSLRCSRVETVADSTVQVNDDGEVDEAAPVPKPAPPGSGLSPGAGRG